MLKRDERIAWSCWFVAAYTATLIAGTILQYACCLWQRPDISSILVAADRSLGLRWVEWADYFWDHPTMDRIMTSVYLCFGPEGYLLVVYLILRDDRPRMIETLVATMVMIWVADVIFGIFPAHTAPIGYGVRQFVLNQSGTRQIEILLSGRGLYVDELAGLVSFPSIHTAGSILLAYLFRGSRIWPVILLLSIVTIAAVPIIGGHYFVDVIAGFMLAALSIWCARLAAPSRPGY